LSLLAAIAFLTRLPVGRYLQIGPKEIAHSARWFPLVGALLGLFSVGALWILTPFFPPFVTAVAIVALDAVLTGAMHFDGLADTADGFGGGATREDVLRIMRDHAIGSYGAVAIGLAIALKIAAIAALAENHRALAALIVAPLAGRWSAVLLSATQPYARPVSDDKPGSAGGPTRFIGRTELIVATAIALAIAPALDLWRGLAALGLVAIGSAVWAWRCRRRIGGVTGDTLGAAIEVSECLVLVLFTIR
jgi:cobalamin 5'-phosphate synthase/cobalamin synthase